MTERRMLLELKQVGYRTATTKIVNNNSFTLQRGVFKLITGLSGCGKSPLLKMVASLISSDIGAIIFERQDITTLRPETFRQQDSYFAKTPALFGEKVYDKLIFPGQIRHQRQQPAAFTDDLARFEPAATILQKP
ncbi:ATP-binding cassette domain-containing protein, partial [Salmonella enterica]|uniref:ATP-binding cassette domain-containing protein n=1 Tax=Salmonella enterica TaxID=28901 RepID=UPI000938D2B3